MPILSELHDSESKFHAAPAGAVVSANPLHSVDISIHWIGTGITLLILGYDGQGDPV
jgi:hypothetical protein